MTDTIIDLAMPPSVNSIWRHSRSTGKVYLADRYKTWKRDADNRYLAHKRDWLPIKGRFSIVITLDARKQGRSDPDNRVKAALDWLQRVELIENDNLCASLLVRWGRAPEGCRIKLRAIEPFRETERRAA